MILFYVGAGFSFFIATRWLSWYQLIIVRENWLVKAFGCVRGKMRFALFIETERIRINAKLYYTIKTEIISTVLHKNRFLPLPSSPNTHTLTRTHPTDLDCSVIHYTWTVSRFFTYTHANTHTDTHYDRREAACNTTHIFYYFGIIKCHQNWINEWMGEWMKENKKCA